MKKLNIITSIVQTFIITIGLIGGCIDAIINFEECTKWDGLFIMVACVLFSNSCEMLVKELTEADR